MGKPLSAVSLVVKQRFTNPELAATLSRHQSLAAARGEVEAAEAAEEELDEITEHPDDDDFASWYRLHCCVHLHLRVTSDSLVLCALTYNTGAAGLLAVPSSPQSTDRLASALSADLYICRLVVPSVLLPKGHSKLLPDNLQVCRAVPPESCPPRIAGVPDILPVV